MVGAMYDLRVELFDQLHIKSKMDIDKKIRYIYCIIKGLVLKNILKYYWPVNIQQMFLLATSGTWETPNM